MKQNQNQQSVEELEAESGDEELEPYECPHEYEHVDHLETVADQYRNELYVCMFCNHEKVVKHYFGVRDD